jgi:hypothetical protein
LWATAKVRGDVGGALETAAAATTTTAVLRSVLGVVYVETTHVELISHDEVGEIGRLKGFFCVKDVVRKVAGNYCLRLARR